MKTLKSIISNQFYQFIALLFVTVAFISIAYEAGTSWNMPILANWMILCFSFSLTGMLVISIKCRPEDKQPEPIENEVKEMTVLDYLKCLPQPYRDQALRNRDLQSDSIVVEDSKSALINAFKWSTAPEGFEYWHNYKISL